MTPKQKIDAFVAQYNNTHIDEDGYYGAQCWDVVARYAREKYGCPSFPTVTGGAAGLFTNTAGIISQYFERVANNPNDPNQIPPDGAVIVWGTAWSPPYGHTAVKVSGSGSTMTVFEQNGNNPGGNAYLKIRNYSGVTGWLVPKDKGETMSKPIKGDIEQLLPELWGRGPNPEDYGFTEQSWHDFIYNAVTMYPFQNRKKIIDQFPQLQKDLNTVQSIANIRGDNFNKITSAVGVPGNPDESVSTKAVIDKVKALLDQVSALQGSLSNSNQTIIALQTQIKDMGDRPTTAQYKELQEAIDKANTRIMEDQGKLEQAHAQVADLTKEKAEAEKTGNLFTRWIGDLINKIAGVK